MIHVTICAEAEQEARRTALRSVHYAFSRDLWPFRDRNGPVWQEICALREVKRRIEEGRGTVYIGGGLQYDITTRSLNADGYVVSQGEDEGSGPMPQTGCRFRESRRAARS